MTTATTARIRRCIREGEYAVAQNLTLFASRPDAKPSGQDDYTIDSFFDVTAHAQALLTEKFGALSALRRSEAAESSEPMRIGIDVPIVPVLPLARMRDRSRGLDAALIVKGLAIDTASETNSIEAVG